MNEIDVKKFHKKIFTKFRFILKKHFSEEFLSDEMLDTIWDRELEAMILRLRVFIYGEPDLCSISYCVTWWQEIREKILLKWWLKWKPSKKKKISFSVLYPSLKFKDEKHKAYVKTTGVSDE